MNNRPKFITSKGSKISLKTPVVMGIINASPDSFYTKSLSNSLEDICKRIDEMVIEGAQIIDIGGMSTRPDSSPVPINTEIERLLPVLDWMKEKHPQILISIDSYRSEVIRKCIDYEIDIVNDISGANIDREILDVCAENNLIYIASHIQGTPTDMQNNPTYSDINSEVTSYFLEFIALIKRKNIHQFILDPGFGFGKSIDHNYQLLNIYKNLKFLNIPLMAGISRKSMIWKTLNETPDNSLVGSIAAQTIALMNGADILRVHDVKAAVDCIKITQAYLNNSPAY